MEVCAVRGRIAQLGPYGSDETCTPKEEDGIEDHDDQQGPNSKDEKCLRITDVTLLFTVDWA
jgi:hypothetical protein